MYLSRIPREPESQSIHCMIIIVPGVSAMVIIVVVVVNHSVNILYGCCPLFCFSFCHSFVSKLLRFVADAIADSGSRLL